MKRPQFTLRNPDRAIFKEKVLWFDQGLIYGEGPGLASQLGFEAGVELFCDQNGQVEHCGIEVFPLDEGESPDAAFERVLATPRKPQESEIAVSRLRHPNGYLIDLRTGVVSANSDVPIWSLVNPLFPISEEFRDFVGGGRK